MTSWLDVNAPLRRVVTGNDERGRSTVVMDGPANSRTPAMGSGRRYADIWVWEDTPLSLADKADGGEHPYVFPGPASGGHVRVVRGNPRRADYDEKADTEKVAPHPPKANASGRMWDRGGTNAFTSHMHKTQTVDYATLIEGERVLILDDGEVLLKPGDVVIQVGAFHAWSSPRLATHIVFDMIGARFDDGAVGLAQGNDKPMKAPAGWRPPAGVEPIRRVVTIDREPGISSLVSDGPSPDVRGDPARPGFAATRFWVTDSTPAPIVYETLHLPHTIEPPKNGTVLRALTLPPDASWKGKVGEAEVRAWFAAMGSPGASTYSATARHPYMQKTRTCDFCFVVKGEAVLVLDEKEVTLRAGEHAVVRGSNHAWSNRSNAPAVVMIASHDAA